MPSLLTLDAEYQAIMAAIDLADGELTPELQGQLDACLNAGDDKLDGYGALIRYNQLHIAAHKEERERHACHVARLEKVNEDLKARALASFKLRGLTHHRTARFGWSVCTNGGRQAVDVDVPVESLPPCYQVVTIAADKDKLRNHLLAGNTIDGVALVARGQHLRIT